MVAEGFSIPPELVQLADKGGAFGAGVVLGGLTAVFFSWLQSGNERTRMQLDAQREAELRKQLELKDERISRLHKEIERILLILKEKK